MAVTWSEIKPSAPGLNSPNANLHAPSGNVTPSNRDVDAGTAAGIAAVRPPLCPSAETAKKLASALRATDFPGPSPREVLGPQVGNSYLRTDLPLYLRRLADPTPLNFQIKLFALGIPITQAEARQALRPLELEPAIAEGLLELSAGQVEAWIAVSRFDQLLIAHDSLAQPRLQGLADHVLGINPAAATLANITPRRSCGSTLDIGAGGGIQALLAASHSKRVIATDTNPRALDFARFNADLNGINNIEVRLGSLYEPVRGSVHDLIVCNPPYVISPESKFIYRDSGMGEDHICEQVLREAPNFLAEGGMACVLCNWALRQGERGVEPLQRWVAGVPCDIWLIHSTTQDPLSYAANWTRDRNAAKYARDLETWTEHYKSAGIEAIGLGAVILRKRTGKTNWVRVDPTPGGPVESCTELARSVMATEDAFSGADGGWEEVRHWRLKLAERHRMIQTMRAKDGQHEVIRTDLEIQNGFAFRAGIDESGMQFLKLCDGTHTFENTLETIAAANRLSSTQCREIGLFLARRMLAMGILTRADTRAPDLAEANTPSSDGEGGQANRR